MTDPVVELAIQATSSPDGRTELRVLAGDRVLLQDVVALASADERERFAARVVEAAPALDHGQVLDRVAALSVVPCVWPTPAAPRPRSTVEPYEPPPVDVMPGPARALIEAAAQSIDCDVAFVLLPVLATMSAAVGATRTLRLRPGQDEAGLLWTCTVCESGSGKSPAIQFATAPIRRREKLERRSWKAAMQNYDRDLDAWEKSRRGRGEPTPKPRKPPAPRWYASDVTIEKVSPMLEDTPRGFLLARDELAGWLAFDRYSKARGAEQAAWLSIHSGQSLAVDRKSGDRTYVDRPFVAITGGVQPKILRTIVSADLSLVDAGLLGRVLLCQPPTWQRRWNEDGVPARVEAAWGQFVDSLCGLEMESDRDQEEPRPRILGMTSAAKAVWCAWFTRAQEGKETAASASERAAWAKIETAAARLALLVHLGRRVVDRTLGETVDEQSMVAGVRLAEWFARESARVYAMLWSAESSVLSVLLERVRRAGGDAGVTANEWAKRTQRGDRRDVAAAEAELDQLVRANAARWVDTRTGQVGRPARRLVLLSPCPRPPETPETGATGDAATCVSGVSGVSSCGDIDIDDELARLERKAIQEVDLEGPR